MKLALCPASICVQLDVRLRNLIEWQPAWSRRRFTGEIRRQRLPEVIGVARMTMGDKLKDTAICVTWRWQMKSWQICPATAATWALIIRTAPLARQVSAGQGCLIRFRLQKRWLLDIG